jgi:UPF0176 protein
MIKAEEMQRGGVTPVFEHISTYWFTPIDDPVALKKEFEEKLEWIVGTILVGNEGVNMFLSGLSQDTQKFKSWMENDVRFKGAWWKVSPLHALAYAKNPRVRIKKEIVTTGYEDVNPLHETAPHLPGSEFQKWLDEGRKVVILDTRNDYEYRVGTFKNALLLPMTNFRQFPKLMEESGVDKEKDVIVSFCTGGIRCEKGAPILKRHGYKNTYQLQGGILGYFNDMKEDAMKYWEGECFVFDRRVSVDHNWQPSKKWTLCHVCREPLDDKQREDPKYKEDVSCPYCIGKTEQEIESDRKSKQKSE